MHSIARRGELGTSTAREPCTFLPITQLARQAFRSETALHESGPQARNYVGAPGHRKTSNIEPGANAQIHRWIARLDVPTSRDIPSIGNHLAREKYGRDEAL